MKTKRRGFCDDRDLVKDEQWSFEQCDGDRQALANSIEERRLARLPALKHFVAFYDSHPWLKHPMHDAAIVLLECYQIDDEIDLKLIDIMHGDHSAPTSLERIVLFLDMHSPLDYCMNDVWVYAKKVRAEFLMDQQRIKDEIEAIENARSGSGDGGDDGGKSNFFKPNF